MVWKTKTISLVLITVSLLYISYSLTVFSSSNSGDWDGNSSETQDTVIIINDRRRFVGCNVCPKNEELLIAKRLHYNQHDQIEKDLCQVKHILKSIEKQYVDGYSPVESVNCSRILYNRVPKCGSRTVLATFEALSKHLKYSVIGLEKPSTTLNYYSDRDQLKAFVKNFTEFESPFLLSQHVHYINFSSFSLPPPVYINVIRDPVERQISHYYYKMYGSSNKPLSQPRSNQTIDQCVTNERGSCYKINQVIPFFCGHTKDCRMRSRNSLQQAKRVVQETVMVIGFTEDLPAFMEVLEYLLPTYFTNAKDIFNGLSSDLQNETKTAKKPEVKPKTIERLKDHLKLEYEFYDFAKQRFYNLLKRIRKVTRLSKDNILQEKGFS